MVLASSCELLLRTPRLTSGRKQVERIARACEENARTGADLPDAGPCRARGGRHASGQPPPGGRGLAGDSCEPIERKGLELICPGNPLDTRYNATFLHAVMGNLLRNALHYTSMA